MVKSSRCWDPVARKAVTVLQFVPRFVRQSDIAALSNLWHLSRTACSGMKNERRYERLLWASSEFAKQFTYVSATGAYKDLTDMLEFGGR